MTVSIRDAAPGDLPALVDIYNQAQAETLAIWNDAPVTLEARGRWLRDRQGRDRPVLVAVAEGRVAGYASYDTFRPFDGYRRTMEHSVYVVPDLHRQGIGRALLAAMIERARADGMFCLIGGIEGGNTPSIALHAALGFKQVAYMPEVGEKFGRRLDLVFMQKNL